MQQLPLEVRLADHAVFDSFHAAGNELLLHQLRSAATLPGQPPLWLWAPSGQGKSHLLQAAVALADEAGRRAAYLPLDSSPPLPAGVLEGMGTLALVCLDDLQVVTGQPEWERALFRLHEELRNNAGNLVIASKVPPAESGIALADLASRLKSGTTFRVQALADWCDAFVLAYAAAARDAQREQMSDEAGALCRNADRSPKPSNRNSA